MSRAYYYRSIIGGIIIILGLAGGVIAWAMHSQDTATKTEIRIDYQQKELDKLERNQQARHDELIGAITRLEKKLDE